MIVYLLLASAKICWIIKYNNSRYGVTWTDNGDGAGTLTGTNTESSTAYFRLSDN